MSDETLKPCPLCGGKVSIARTDNGVGERWWFITRGTTYNTTRCPCRLFLESEKFTCGWNDDYSLECRAKLIDRWNTRAELGSGTLTAEQVRKVLLYHLPHREYYSVEQTDAWQEIANELNAELGSGTCRITASSTDGLCSDSPRHRFELSCGHGFTVDGLGAPVACPVCGKAVKR